MGFIKKLLLADLVDKKPATNSFINHKLRIRNIWNNTGPHQYNTIGIERLVQIILLTIQFGFPGLYVRAFFSRYGVLVKNIGIEFFVLFKLSFVLATLYFHLYQCHFALMPNGNSLFLYVAWYFSAETLLYIPTLLFCERAFANRRSVGRSAILMLINYTEVIFTFALTYAATKGLSYTTGKSVTSILDCIYFSVITSCTIGYGDISPVSHFVKVCVILQAVIFLIFGAVLVSILLSKNDDEISKSLHKPEKTTSENLNIKQ